MPEYTKYQKKVIDRYYDNRDTIMLTKLAELVSELYLAESDKKREQLWKRVEAAMKNLKIQESVARHLLTQRKVELLAKHLQDWTKK